MPQSLAAFASAHLSAKSFQLPCQYVEVGNAGSHVADVLVQQPICTVAFSCGESRKRNRVGISASVMSSDRQLRMNASLRLGRDSLDAVTTGLTPDRSSSVQST